MNLCLYIDHSMCPCVWGGEHNLIGVDWGILTCIHGSQNVQWYHYDPLLGKKYGQLVYVS